MDVFVSRASLFGSLLVPASLICRVQYAISTGLHLVHIASGHSGCTGLKLFVCIIYAVRFYAAVCKHVTHQLSGPC